ncbi:plasmid pRiA4b ORF-3 family protein [Akkermansiaceae bacterium]|nr:plasmid pRiA4b ORF-3 family protein [Akkermansiaceae bacterium]MDA7929973.1 plasmid pRiA4b ORF-3 family protein [Akkermansiaceae bacterium]MDA8976471.1 plasmid pRiA4b ORF-3 family protein [bacterium]
MTSHFRVIKWPSSKLRKKIKSPKVPEAFGELSLNRPPKFELGVRPSVISSSILPAMTDPLDDLLAKMPEPDASESEIEAFMEKVMSTPGGAELIHSFAEKITAGGSLDTMLKEEEAGSERLALKSPARFIFRIELLDTKPLVWRRLSLPADCAYVHLHHAIQDSFGWEDAHLHRFEIWEDGHRELTFSPDESEDTPDYCEVENRIIELFRENVGEFLYLYDFGDNWRHRVVIEDFVQAGVNGTSKDLKPHLHDGEGHGPPESCGGADGFADFLKGDHPFCENYEAEILEQFRNAKPDISKIAFR